MLPLSLRCFTKLLGEPPNVSSLTLVPTIPAGPVTVRSLEIEGFGKAQNPIID